jgi:hypothetical protein
MADIYHHPFYYLYEGFREGGHSPHPIKIMKGALARVKFEVLIY